MKLKSTNLARGVFAWFCFLLCAFSIIAGLTFAMYYPDIFEAIPSAVDKCGQALSGDLRETDSYKDNVSILFERLYYSTQSNAASNTSTDVTAEKDNDVPSNGYHYYISRDESSTALSWVYVESISKDVLFSVTDYSTDPAGKTITNDSNWDAQTLPEGFNYLFTCENGVTKIYYSDKDGDLNCVFSSDTPGAFYTLSLSYTLGALKQSNAPSPKISFAVHEKPTSYSLSNEIVSDAQTWVNNIRFAISLVAAAVVMFTLMLLLSILFRQDRKLFERYIAHGLKWIWIEVKVIAVFVWAFVVLNIISYGFDPAGTAVTLFSVFFVFYLLGIDISHNRRIYRHNIIHSVLKLVLGNREGKKFEQIVYRKYMATAGILMGLCIVGILGYVFFYSHWLMGTIWFVAFYVGLFSAGVGTLVWFAWALRDDLRDYSKLMEQVEQMYKGDLDAMNHLPATSPLYDSAMQLNMIRDGIRIAVEEGIKSERTKVELITNVSHDIKTPLTSIISYIELMKTEPDLPPHMQDYLKIVSQKADRLRHMLQDIFDVSKAATGNITLMPEYIDLDKLLRQTLGDMDGVMNDSELTWRVQIPQEDFPVYADGQRMYRVFQNLIKNAAQYALEGSRVYVELQKQGQNAVVTIQNISKYELTMDGDSLTARFVRGDDSRSTSGSGLGLSIAKSFTEACGGTFHVTVKGDLFTVMITLPLKEPPKEPEKEPLPETADAENKASEPEINPDALPEASEQTENTEFPESSEPEN